MPEHMPEQTQQNSNETSSDFDQDARKPGWGTGLRNSQATVSSDDTYNGVETFEMTQDGTTARGPGRLRKRHSKRHEELYDQDEKNDKGDNLSMELARIVSDAPDLDWLDKAECADMDVKEFFVDAGHTISMKTINVCRECPVREECLRWCYERKIVGGYFAGMSQGQRKRMSLDEALVFIKHDKSSRGTR